MVAEVTQYNSWVCGHCRHKNGELWQYFVEAKHQLKLAMSEWKHDIDFTFIFMIDISF
jgi:hypothetical protein